MTHSKKINRFKKFIAAVPFISKIIVIALALTGAISASAGGTQ